MFTLKTGFDRKPASTKHEPYRLVVRPGRTTDEASTNILNFLNFTDQIFGASQYKIERKRR